MKQLDQIRALEQAATKGPWFAEGEPEEVFEPRTVYYVFHNGDTMDRDKIADSYGPEAEFIAAARDFVPKAITAIEAVLAELAKWEQEAVASDNCAANLRESTRRTDWREAEKYEQHATISRNLAARITEALGTTS